MKLLRPIFTIWLLLTVTCTVGAQSFQIYNPENYQHELEDGNRDSQGKIIRGSYLTNQWFDNWAFGVGAGIQGTFCGMEGSGIRITPAYEITAMKWVTPTIAARLGFQGFRMEERYPEVWLGGHYPIARDPDDKTLIRYKQTYIHVDMLLSLSNFLFGYRESRSFNYAPYVHAGFLRLGHPDYSYFNGTYRDREVAMGAGMFLTYKITNHISATADLRWSNFSGRYHDDDGGRVHSLYLTFGANYTIFKWYWQRHATVMAPLSEGYNDAIASLEAVEIEKEHLVIENQKLKDDNIVLNTSNDKLKVEVRQLEDQVQAQAAIDSRKNPNDELLARVAAAELVLYYELDVDRLSPTESLRLENYIVTTWNNDPKHVFYITGSADAGTGSAPHNSKLSRRRAENIKKTLVRSYGIPESQVVIKANIVSNKHADGRLDRCVLFENE